MDISRPTHYLKNAIFTGAKSSFHHIIPFGILGVFSIIPFYFLNIQISPHAYENLPLRIVGSIMCLFLVLKNYWPNKLKKFLPLYWYLTLLYIPTFFLFFMAFKNNMSPLWQLNIVMLVLFIALLVDWISFIMLISFRIFTRFHRLLFNFLFAVIP